MSTVIGEFGSKSKLGASGTFTNAATPSKLNACPTMPLANVAPFWSVPLLPSCISLALPSPGHQLTSPAGGGVQATINVGQTNFWMRLLYLSATKTLPLPSTATPTASKNCPSAVPKLPHLVRKVPVFVNFWMRLLRWSATNTFPLPSTATPSGRENCPSPGPEIPAWHEEVQVSKAAMPSCTPQPKVRRKVPVFVNFWMRLLFWSPTKTFPLPSTA